MDQWINYQLMNDLIDYVINYMGNKQVINEYIDYVIN